MLNPFWWYYTAASTVGAVNVLTIMFVAVPDITPEESRAASFGLLLASFYGVFFVAPSLCLWLNHLHTNAVSFAATVLAFGFVFVALPETLKN